MKLPSRPHSISDVTNLHGPSPPLAGVAVSVYGTGERKTGLATTSATKKGGGGVRKGLLLF